MTRWFIAGLLALVLSCTANANIVVVDPATIGLDSDKLADMQKALGQDLNGHQVPGAVLLIARKGKVGFLGTAGFQTPAHQQPMTSKTIFRLYSMTKPITSVAAMILVEDGKLALDDPVSKYIPAFAQMTVLSDGGKAVPAKNQMTVRDLLRHTSGIIYGVFTRGPFKKLYRDAGVSSKDHTLKDFAARLAKLPLRHEPGTAWHYGRSTDLLGRVIEVAAGQSFDEFMSIRIFKPLGITDAGFYQPTGKAARIAEPRGGLFDVMTPKPMLSGGGGLTMSTEDFYRFAMMLRNGGSLDGQRILSPASLALMTQDQIAGLDQQFYFGAPAYGFGLGVSVRLREKGRPGNIGEYGWGGYAGTYFWVDPVKDLFVVFMMQDQFSRRYFRGRLREWVYGAVVD